MIYTKEFVAKEADRVVEMLNGMSQEWDSVLVSKDGDRHGLESTNPYLSKVINAMENVSSLIRHIT